MREPDEIDVRLLYGIRTFDPANSGHIPVTVSVAVLPVTGEGLWLTFAAFAMAVGSEKWECC